MTIDQQFIHVRLTNGRWRPDRVDNWKIVNQLRKEAGIHNAPWPDDSEAYDKLLIAASSHGLGLETDYEEAAK